MKFHESLTGRDTIYKSVEWKQIIQSVENHNLPTKLQNKA